MAKGIICKVLSGKYEGRIASVANKQDKEVTSKGKVHAYFFIDELTPLLDYGKQINSLISLDRLEKIGMYD